VRCRGVRDFGVNQITVIAKNSVDVTSDKTAVRFCTFFGYFFVQAKKVTGLQDKNTVQKN